MVVRHLEFIQQVSVEYSRYFSVWPKCSERSCEMKNTIFFFVFSYRVKRRFFHDRCIVEVVVQ